MIAEYWLACYLGQAWLWLQRGLRPAMADLPELCRRVARGEQLPAAQLWEVQDFAVKVWWRAGMAATLLLFPIIGLGALLRPGRVGRDIGADAMAVLVCIGGIALVQMGLLRFRANRTGDHVRRAGPPASAQPLPQGSLGLPREGDFWVMLAVAIALFAVVFYAGTRSPH